MTPAFPVVFDNTMISTYRACPRKFWWRHVKHLSKTDQSIHLVSGAAFARGLEVTRKEYFNKGTDFEIALAKGVAACIASYGPIEPHPKYQNKIWWRMVAAMAYYFDVWPIDQSLRPIAVSPNRHAIEWNFSVPIPGIVNPQTGDPILYCGRFDMAVEHPNGMLMGEDDKTTSQLGQSWYDRWCLSGQIMGYMWGAREHGLNLGGFNVRGISLLKNGHGHAETTVMVNPWEIDRFIQNLIDTVYDIGEDWRKNNWQYNFGGACSAYGGCDYLMLCQSPTPEDWIPIHFVEHKWNPLASRD